MAIDSRDKRASVLGHSLLALRPLPNPGTQTPGDRAHLAGVYRGLFEEDVEAPTYQPRPIAPILSCRRRKLKQGRR